MTLKCGQEPITSPPPRASGFHAHHLTLISKTMSGGGSDWKAMLRQNEKRWVFNDLVVTDRVDFVANSIMAPSLSELMLSISNRQMWRDKLVVELSGPDSNWRIDNQQLPNYAGAENVVDIEFRYARPFAPLHTSHLFKWLRSVSFRIVVSEQSQQQPLLSPEMNLPRLLEEFNVQIEDSLAIGDGDRSLVFSVDENLAPLRKLRRLRQLVLLSGGDPAAQPLNRVISIEITRDFFRDTNMTTSLKILRLKSYRMQIESATLQQLTGLHKLYIDTVDVTRPHTLLDSIVSMPKLRVIDAPQGILSIPVFLKAPMRNRDHFELGMYNTEPPIRAIVNSNGCVRGCREECDCDPEVFAPAELRRGEMEFYCKRKVRVDSDPDYGVVYHFDILSSVRLAPKIASILKHTGVASGAIAQTIAAVIRDSYDEIAPTLPEIERLCQLNN